MKRLLKYLIPVLVIAAFFDVAGSVESSLQNTSSDAFSLDGISLTDTFSANSSGIAAPQTVSLSGSVRLHNNARRTVNAHSRSLFELAKSAKAFNASVLHYFQRFSVVINTSVIEHSHKLVYLGKLII